MLTLKINNLKVTVTGNCPNRICYILYPLDILDRWMIEAAKRFAVSIAVVTQIGWDNQLTPWKATGIPAGTPDFAGEASRFFDSVARKRDSTGRAAAQYVFGG